MLYWCYCGTFASFEEAPVGRANMCPNWHNGEVKVMHPVGNLQILAAWRLGGIDAAKELMRSMNWQDIWHGA